MLTPLKQFRKHSNTRKKEKRQSCTGSLWARSEGAHMVIAKIIVPTIFSNMSD